MRWRRSFGSGSIRGIGLNNFRGYDRVVVHSIFDLLALIVALAMFRLVPATAPGVPLQPWQVHSLYIGAASLGATAGAYAFGTGNLWLTGIDGVARSVEGALAGAIAGIEWLKWRAGISG